MPLRTKLGAALMITVICAVTTSVGLTAEPTSSNPSIRNRQKLQTQADMSSTASKVTPAGFSTMSEMQDSVIDGSEAVRCRAREKASRIYRESLIARAHQKKQEELHVAHENVRDWFCYIRGYGPTVWTRNGPECGYRPPSIPFAKRAGGYDAPAWQGVTGIPKQPQISPLTTNAPPDCQMNY